MKLRVLALVIAVAMLLAGCTGKEETAAKYAVINGDFDQAIDTEADFAWDTYFFASVIEQEDGMQKVTSTAPAAFISIWQVLPIEGQAYREKFNKQAEELKKMEQEMSLAQLKTGDSVSMSVDIFVSEEANMPDTIGLRLYIEAENEKGIKTTIGESGVQDVKTGEWFTFSTIASGNEGVIPDDTVLIVISIQMDLPDDGYILLDNVELVKNEN